MKVQKLTLSLPEKITQELDLFVQELGEKKSRIVANALENYFDMLDLSIAKKRSTAVKSGVEETLSLEQMRNEIHA